MTRELSRGDAVRVIGSRPGHVGTVAELGTSYNVHGHASPVVTITWPNGVVTTWAERDVMPV